MREDGVNVLMNTRIDRYQSVDELRNMGLSQNVLKQSADADAFRSMGLDQPQALWEISKKDTALGIFQGQPNHDPDKYNISCR